MVLTHENDTHAIRVLWVISPTELCQNSQRRQDGIGGGQFTGSQDMRNHLFHQSLTGVGQKIAFSRGNGISRADVEHEG